MVYVKRPVLWMLVGANGAGKSTFFEYQLSHLQIPFINADVIARQRFPNAPEAHSYEAAKIAEKLRYQYLEEGKSFCFETVFSHPSKVDFIRHALEKNYEVSVVFIHLCIDSLNVFRVKQRVAEGGHDVDPDKIKARYQRMQQHVLECVGLVDYLYVIDNSSFETPFRLMLKYQGADLVFRSDELMPWASSLFLED